MPSPRRAPRRRVDGVLLLDKPSGITSNAALSRVRRLFNAEKAGHTGTLDPLASGLLPICFGSATRFAQFLLDADKRYVATIRFGETTTTLDAEGDVVATRPLSFSRADLDGALARFTGAIRQIPPAHSALKFEGRPHYEYARRGIDVPRPIRDVTIHALRLVDWRPPDAVVDVACSKGTYVRTLAADLGEVLGCGAHLRALRRTTTGPFALDDAVTFDDVDRMDEQARAAALRPLDGLLAGMPKLVLDTRATKAVMQGRQPAVNIADARYRLYGPQGEFVGVGDVAGERLRAVRLLAWDAESLRRYDRDDALSA
jgi:tRNA pseudouridine55 synthase